MEAAEVPRRPKILVVDDEQSITLLLAQILERQGYETATAYSGEEAICTACSFRPDCLLSDIDLQMMNGVDAAMEIVNLSPACKVLFISGHISCHALMEHASAQGYHFEFLAKPIFPTELLRKVSKLLCGCPEEKCQ